uniref:BTB domain-containing protein n=1 Tax=Parastrongyloides trichosuri TaxID=131310 RepID=A0A0N4ZYX5_PARTI
MEKEDEYSEWCGKFNRSSQSLKMMYQLKKMRENNEMCDFIIKSSDGREFHVHKLVVHASIPYFNSFNTFYSHDENHKDIVTLDMLSPKATELIIDYIYDGKIQYNKDIVLDIVYASDYLQMESLKNEAIKELFNYEDKDMLFNEKVMAVIEASILTNDKAMKFYAINFCEFSEKESFCILSLNSLIGILEKDYLDVPSEEFVFDSAMKWMYFDYENRKQFVLNIFSILRIAFLDYSIIFDKLLTEPIIIHNEETRKKIYHYLRVCLEGSPKFEYIQNYSPERNNYQLTCLSIDSSYRQNVACVNMKKFVLKSKMWHSHFYELFHKTDHITGIKYNNKIYFLQYEENEDYGSGVILDIDQQTTKRKTFSSGPRSGRCMAQFEDKIFTIGGLDMQGRNNLVECYSFRDNKITSLAPIPSGVINATSVVHGNHIYVIGGQLAQPLRIARRYFILTNSWEDINQMYYPRYKASAIAHRKQIFVIGGRNYNGVLNNCEVYDVESDNWTIIPNMPYKRAAASLSIRQNFLHVVGGYGESSEQIMQYDLLQCRWYEGPILEDLNLLHIAV